MALLLKKRGILRVRPLAGGLEEWKRLGFPLTEPELVQITAGDD